MRADIREQAIPSLRGGKVIPLLSDIRVELYRSETVAILGVSGAGKSTLKRLEARIQLASPEV